MFQGSLPDLYGGDVATIARINGSRVAGKRLADMGFIRGARVEMLKRGDPCIVRLDGTCVGLGTAYQEAIVLDAV